MLEGVFFHGAVGVDGDGVSDEFEHGDVGGGVGVGEAGAQVDMFALCDCEEGVCFGGSFAVVEDFSGEFAVGDFEFGGGDEFDP